MTAYTTLDAFLQTEVEPMTLDEAHVLGECDASEQTVDDIDDVSQARAEHPAAMGDDSAATPTMDATRVDRLQVLVSRSASAIREGASHLIHGDHRWLAGTTSAQAAA